MATEIKVPDIGDFKDVEVIDVLVKPGDKVICNKFSGMTAKVDEEELVIVRQNDILAVVEM